MRRTNIRFRVARRRISLTMTLIAAIALLGTQTGVLARLQATLDSPSPATGHASIIAQGVSEFPAEAVAWRVVLDTAEPLDTAQPVERALGFVVAEPDGVQVADETSGANERLAPGEASFVAEGAVQLRASLTDEDTSYLRVALVPEADVNDPGNDELVFGGELFAVPDGQHDIDLLRDVLASNEESRIAGGDYPVLVIATGGAIEIDAGGTPVTLEDGEAAEFTGDLVITGTAAGASYVAGIIGPEVPVPPRTTGTITYGIYLCQPGVTPDDLGSPLDIDIASSCETMSDPVNPTLTTPDGEELTLDDAEKVREGVYSWTALPYGVYAAGDPTELPSGASSPIFYDREGRAFVNPDIAIDSETPDVHVDLYLFQTASGSITITVYACPSGWDPSSLDAGGCDVVTSGFEITLIGGPEGGALTLADAEATGESFVWSELGVSPDGDTFGNGYYTIEPSQPDGFNAYAMSGTASSDVQYVNLTPDAPDATVSIFNYVTEDPTGTVTLDTIVCPSVDSSPDDCSREFGPNGVTGIFIQDNGGEFPALTEANGSQEGDGPYVWPNVALGGYFMDTSGLTPPDGYQIIGVVLTPDGTDISAGFEINEDIQIANIVVLLAPANSGDGTPAATSADEGGSSDGTGGGTPVAE